MSTIRRRLLTDFIDFENNKIIKFYSTCCHHSRVCKIHFRFESYNECFHRNQHCDVRVIENE